MKIGIIDYGVGNTGSIFQAIEQLRATPLLINRSIDLHIADLLILPGVGNFTDCMQILRKGDWCKSIKEEVIGYKKPILGICLGMQLLADFGFEGADDLNQGTAGLGLIPGSVVSLKSEGCSLRTPHVGWNSLTKINNDSWLLKDIPVGTDFYFVHSYFFKLVSTEYLISEAQYDINFTAAVGKDRIWGTQFHPEKSSRAGLQILKNFLSCPQC